MYFDPKMILEEYEEFKLQDELNIGYDVEDDNLPDEIEEDSWIDGLLTSGFHAVNDDESVSYTHLTLPTNREV